MSLLIAIIYIISTIIVALISPFWGFLGLIGSILIRFQDRFEQISAHPTFVYMCVACILGFFIHRDRLSKESFWPDKWWKYFVIWTCISLVLKQPGDLINEMRFLLSSVVMYYFASRVLTTESRFLIFFAALATISACMGYEAASSYLTDPDSPFAYVPNDIERRLFGWGRYANANEFGALMVMPLSGVMCLIVLTRSILFKMLYIAVAAGLLYVTGLSYSRTCMVIAGIMVMTAAALWSQTNIIKKVFVLGIVGSLILMLLTAIPGPFQERILSVLNFSSDASFLGRTRAWEQGFHMIKHNSLFGVGMSQWSNYHGVAPHNSFVQAMAETGLPGIFFYLAALFHSFKMTLKIIAIPQADPRYNYRARVIAIFSTATLIGFMVYAFFGNQAYMPFMFLYSGFCAATTNLISLGEDSKERKSRKPAREQTPHQEGSGKTDDAIAATPKGSRFPQAPL